MAKYTVYKNPSEREFDKCLKPITEYIDDKEVISKFIRGCIDKSGNIYIWNPELYHGDVKDNVKEFEDIFNEDKYTCICAETYQDLTRLINMLKEENWLMTQEE